MTIFIPDIKIDQVNKKELFILTRPFIVNNLWGNSIAEKANWGVDDNEFHYTDTIEKANIVLIPMSINSYFNKKSNFLSDLNTLCSKHNVMAFGFITGDFGYCFPEYSNIIYFRASGFKNKLSKQNQGFPVALSDHYARIYKTETLIPSPKSERPIIGFCGHASLDKVKYVKEVLKCVKENIYRFTKNPFATNYEPIFASGYIRASLLKKMEQSNLLQTNFIYRKNYRAGVKTEAELEQTTIEYFDNIKNSDYVLCMRGAGNFSVRFYETLMMGKIPVFINTDCLLPFEHQINWKKHVVWVEWHERTKVDAIVHEFHQQLSEEEFVELQNQNRKLWKETLSISGMLKMLQ